MSDINTPYITDPVQIEMLEQSMHGEMKYTLMNDFLSKYSLQHDLYALKGLLSALLEVDLDKITDIVVLNPIEANEAVDDKKCILDIKLELNHEQIINIEIQATYQSFWAERSLTYLCRNFDQLKEGESYDEIKPCIHIGILGDDAFRKDDSRYTGEFFSKYRMLNVKNQKEYSSKFEIRMLLLNHIQEVTEEERNDNNGLYYWAKMFTVKSWEELQMIAQDNPMMKSLAGTVRKLSAEEKVAMACEARRRYSNDMATIEKEQKKLKKEIEQLEQKKQSAEQKAEEAEQKAEEAEQKAEEAEQKAEEAEQKRQLVEQELRDKEREIAELREQLLLSKNK